MSDETRAHLEALSQEWSRRKDAMLERVVGLAAEGQYGEGAALVEAHLAAWQETFPAARLERYERDRLFLYPEATHFSRFAQNLRRLGDLTTRAAHDFGAAQQLLLALVEKKPLGLELPSLPLEHPQVQALLDAVRERHEATSRLFSARSVRVEVQCERFKAEYQREFAVALARSLRPLGLEASADGGAERLLVSGLLEGPDSAHYIGDDVCVGSLDVTATWEGSGLGELRFSESVVGSEEDDDFADRLLAATTKTLPLELLKAWALAHPPP